MFSLRRITRFMSSSRLLCLPHSVVVPFCFGGGGIFWCLASESLSHDNALTGPSTVITILKNGYSIHYSGNSQELCDDDLSDHELASLSGLYRCYTGEYSTSRLA